MKCSNCEGTLTAKKKRVRNSGSGSCLLELVGVLLIIFTFFTIIGPIIGFIFLILGHQAAYKKEKIYSCSNCGATF